MIKEYPGFQWLSQGMRDREENRKGESVVSHEKSTCKNRYIKHINSCGCFSSSPWDILRILFILINGIITRYSFLLVTNASFGYIHLILSCASLPTLSSVTGYSMFGCSHVLESTNKHKSVLSRDISRYIDTYILVSSFTFPNTFF